MKVLVTGSSGHLARSVIPLLEERGHEVGMFDLPVCDVRNIAALRSAARVFDACIHLAGMKYADRGELEPLEAVDVNVLGTANVVEAFGANVVMTSTCKAADPETVYGASKLIAERIVLGGDGTVVRLVNVLGSVGSVTDIWAQVPDDEPIPVCHATRLFISDEVAAAMIVDALDFPSGRYGPAHYRVALMTQIARDLYPNRETQIVALRRGDRRHERLAAACETVELWNDDMLRIVGQHDPVTRQVGAKL